MYDWEKSETREGLYKGMAHGIENLAVDWVTGNVYWTDSDYKWIMVADKVIQNIEKDVVFIYFRILTISTQFTKLLTIQTVHLTVLQFILQSSIFSGRLIKSWARKFYAQI